MQQFRVTVDYNGIVLFDPDALVQYFGGSIQEGENILERLTTTDDGEAVIAAGIALPILGINDSTYEVLVRSVSDPREIDCPIIVESGVFPMRVAGRLVIADVAVLAEWTDNLGWQDVRIAPGDFGVTVRGFRAVAMSQVVRFGYELVFESQRQLPAMSASLEKHMQVLELPSQQGIL